jgi:hypothetical protein
MIYQKELFNNERFIKYCTTVPLRESVKVERKKVASLRDIKDTIEPTYTTREASIQGIE